MGFYAPAEIVGDARENGVEVREIDVSFSHAQNTLEEQMREIITPCGSVFARSTGSMGRSGCDAVEGDAA